MKIIPKVEGKYLYFDETKFPKFFFSDDDNLNGKIVYSDGYSKKAIVLENTQVEKFIEKLEDFLKNINCDYTEYNI